jgi:hypothetical protein
MTASDKTFTGSIAQVYDRLVPMIFEPYARDLAQRIKGHNPGDLLETAAGTGAVTGALASLLPDTDRNRLNEPMLAQAKRASPVILKSCGSRPTRSPCPLMMDALMSLPVSSA